MSQYRPARVAVDDDDGDERVMDLDGILELDDAFESLEYELNESTQLDDASLSSASSDDDEATKRLETINAIENFVLDFLSQTSHSCSLLAKGEPFPDVVIELINRTSSSSDKTKKIKFPGARPVPAAQKLACIFSLLDNMHESLINGVASTKRDIFYRNVQLFKSQSVVDELSDDLAATLGVRRSDLCIKASPKGLFASSALKLVLKDDSTIWGKDGIGTLIPPGEDIASFEVEEDVEWVLVVEKEAVFHQLCQEYFAGGLPLSNFGRGIVLTGKGYPDVATRSFLHTLSQLPCFALLDADPHGLDILSTYKYGSKAMEHESEHLTAPSLKWIGLKLKDVIDMGVDRDKLLPITAADRQKALAMLKRPVEVMPKRWRKELQRMLYTRRKAEIEIIAGFPDSDEFDSIFLGNSLIDESVSAMPRQTSLLVQYLANTISERLKPLDTIEPSAGDHPETGEVLLLDL